jgi:hypothetical protein
VDACRRKMVGVEQISRYLDGPSARRHVHAHFAPRLNHPKMKHFFTSGEESAVAKEKEGNARKEKGQDMLSSSLQDTTRIAFCTKRLGV